MKTPVSGWVVVVDDHPDLRQLLAVTLEQAGFSVLSAGSEFELHRLLTCRRPDALLIDLQRSAADGLELVAHLRARAALREVPILFLAGSQSEDLEQQALRAGADWFGLRPLGIAELQQQLIRLIRRANAEPTPIDLRRAAIMLRLYEPAPGL